MLKLHDVASTAINNELHSDSFKIITKKGTVISTDEIRVKGKSEIVYLGDSLEKNSAWSALKTYYLELFDSGVLEE
ncbi:hypothetical protein [Zooshikella harenae]|uniref:Uncharacterized protein n=1 Tax=Zooshikella harenae TaxID=2827238 RepID=A0ABS5ZJY5_9GAMM|nr:hypothetical protein [Zooshikella harenae]MBU2714386.1 hypothetical protein [Zooshikella harenae]